MERTLSFSGLNIQKWQGQNDVLVPALLGRSDAVEILSANDSAAFKESCFPIG